jgi:sugar phosphate isomerase/epimerase
MANGKDMRPIYLDHLSLVDVTGPELIEIAAGLGYAGVSLFVSAIPLNPALDLLDDAASRGEVMRAIRHHGLSVGIVEPFMLDDAPDWALFERMVALTAELDGTVNTIGFDEEPARLEASVGRLAGLATAAGVPMTIEAFPLSAIRTQADALRLARIAGQGVGLCVDTLHVIRSGGSWADVAALPPDLIRHVQINDGPLAPPADRYAEAGRERSPPGHGEFGLEAFLPLVPPHASLAIEAPFVQPGTTPRARARILIEATRALLAA